MQKYEYIQHMLGTMDTQSPAEFCNELAKGGWRLVSISLPVEWQSWFMIFERKLPVDGS